MSVYRIFWVNFTKNITRVCFNHYQNVCQDIPDNLINQKTSPKKNLRRSQFSKKRGGGPARYDRDHRFNGFFLKPNNSNTYLLYLIILLQKHRGILIIIIDFWGSNVGNLKTKR